jgi:hypothetical protein
MKFWEIFRKAVLGAKLEPSDLLILLATIIALATLELPAILGSK